MDQQEERNGMALARNPDAMAAEIAAQGRGPSAKNEDKKSYSVRDTSPPQQRLLRQLLSEHEWKLFTWLLNTCELSARDERVWKVQRRLLLDEFHRHDEGTRKLVNQIAGLTATQIMEMALKGKDNNDEA